MTLSRHALGVYPAKPGFEECRIAPRPGHLKWAKGVYPCPKGEIKLDWRTAAGAFAIDVDLPEGMKTVLAIPSEVSGQDYVCLVDGKPVEHRGEVQLAPGKHTVHCARKKNR
jgi:hypothetical protein